MTMWICSEGAHCVDSCEGCCNYIEVKEVTHGRWIKDGDFLVCLNCEGEINVKNSLGVENHKNFCPNCGAKMDLEVQYGS